MNGTNPLTSLWLAVALSARALYSLFVFSSRPTDAGWAHSCV